MKKFILIIHPIMFAFYGVLAFFVTNITQLGLSGLRTIGLTILWSIVLIIILRVIIHNGVKAGLISSGVILLVVSYGHVKNLIEALLNRKLWVSSSVLFTVIWLLILIFWCYWVMKRINNQEVISNYLNWVSIILIVFPIYQLFKIREINSIAEIWKNVYMEQAWKTGGISDIHQNRIIPSAENRSDIYYIILDAYTRADILTRYYHYDNSWFINALAERGFCITEKSISNYSDTEFSLASSLNMIHISDTREFIEDNTHLKNSGIITQIASQLIQNNKVADFLRKQGYTFVAFDNGYSIALPTKADQLVKSSGDSKVSRTDIMFEMMFLDTTIGKFYLEIAGDGFLPLQNLFNAHREKVLFSFETLSTFAEKQGYYFIFAHILSPHTPFIFGPDGEKLKGVDPYTLMDYHPGNPDNVRLYRDQVNYINNLTLKAIDSIIKNSTPQPIIILQGDHGSRVFSGEEPGIPERLDLMFPILNAYYLPGEACHLVYSTITPVNTFRMIFNNYFGTNLELLEDKGFWSRDDRDQLEFIDICQEYGYCSP